MSKAAYQAHNHSQLQKEACILPHVALIVSNSPHAQADQLMCLCAVLGFPTSTTWPRGLDLAASLGFSFPDIPSAVDWSELLTGASPHAVDLIASMCAWDPAQRPTAQEALQHPFFRPEAPLPLAQSAELKSRLAAASKRLGGRLPSGPTDEHGAAEGKGAQAACQEKGRSPVRRTQSPQLQRLMERTAGRQAAVLKGLREPREPALQPRLGRARSLT